MKDFSQTVAIQKRLMSATKKLEEMSNSLGYAKTIREYSSDRQKRALSELVVKFLNQGEGVTAAEHRARASQEYQEKMKQIESDYEAAEKTIAEYNAAQAAHDTARSLLSFSRESLRTLEG